jgi:hypothetical protein
MINCTPFTILLMTKIITKEYLEKKLVKKEEADGQPFHCAFTLCKQV